MQAKTVSYCNLCRKDLENHPNYRNPLHASDIAPRENGGIWRDSARMCAYLVGHFRDLDLIEG